MLLEEFLTFGNIANLCSVIGAVVMGWQAYLYWLKKVEYNKKINKLGRNFEPDIVINLSGHPMRLFEDNWNERKKVIDIAVGSINPLKLNEEADRLIELTIEKARDEINIGAPIIYALPGMTMLTPYLLTKIHGISGMFPHITSSVHTDKGFLWTKPVDLHMIRTKKRFSRDFS